MSSYSEGQVHQLMNALEKAGFATDDVTRLGQLPNLSGIRDVLRGEALLPPEPKPERTYRILRPVAPKPAEPRLFRADETFFNMNSSVKMVLHGSDFTAWFTHSVEEEEDVLPIGDLVPFMLTKGAYDDEIITDLSGEEETAETTLADIWRLMERQEIGGDGVLLTNGCVNIFYVRDYTGVLRAVCVGWDDGGWHADAEALGGGKRFGGSRVFSHVSR